MDNQFLEKNIERYRPQADEWGSSVEKTDYLLNVLMT